MLAMLGNEDKNKLMLHFWQNFLGPFLRSNVFIVLSSVFVGYIAWRIYRNQKDDEKRNAANVVLLEIESAEEYLKKINTEAPFARPGEPDIVLMKTSSWDKYKHLFVNEFSENGYEFRKISDFYSHCAEYDKAVRQENDTYDYNLRQIAKYEQKILANYAKEHAEELIDVTNEQIADLELKYIIRRNKLRDTLTGSATYTAQIDTYIPQRFSNDAKRVLEVIDRNISTSSAGKRLREIAAPKQNLSWLKRN